MLLAFDGLLHIRHFHAQLFRQCGKGLGLVSDGAFNALQQGRSTFCFGVLALCPLPFALCAVRPVSKSPPLQVSSSG